MMKRFLMILVMLFWCNVGFAGECIKGDCNNGNGTFTWPSGQKYAGEWKNNNRHGYGIQTHPNGAKYVGGWKNDTMHGQGTFTWANGAKYVGEYKDGEEHGQGTRIDADGDKYVGEFKNGKKHGQGTLTFTDGVVVVAKFQKDQLTKVISEDTSARDKAEKKMELASMVEDAKETCKVIGFSEGTDKFTDCALKLYTQSVDVAAKNNQTVVMQPQSSGSNSVTIYDPVRDSNALIRQGQRMLSGACTLGINC